MEGIRRKCSFHHGIDVGAEGSKGGLSLSWRHHDVVTLRSYLQDHIDVVIQDAEKGFLWHFTYFSRHPEERAYKKGYGDRLNELYAKDLDDDTLVELTKVQLGLNLEADKEEIFWKQRVRINWLSNSDRNITFFHKMVTGRMQRNAI
ncbi:hypothetical protein J1N35_025187 [Gossypium stocksii]|uniref:Uncharacterized protein n=1 Tax=Gossypium stocksii TaxID=47602 RepID=A0A9D3ZXK1_9ROSI|nr:hypothetical protein J1N35_025187 [Gossypium stocksii]